MRMRHHYVQMIYSFHTISFTVGAQPMFGDVDSSSTITIVDAIVSLQVVSKSVLVGVLHLLLESSSHFIEWRHNWSGRGKYMLAKKTCRKSLMVGVEGRYGDR